MKVLVLASEPVNADSLREALGSDDLDGAEVLVVSPALHESKLRFWISDDDEAIGNAESAQEESVERLSEEGVDAAGDTGEADPALAVQDALATFEADHVVVFSHPEGERDYRENEDLSNVAKRFDVPLTHRLVTREDG